MSRASIACRRPGGVDRYARPRRAMPAPAGGRRPRRRPRPRAAAEARGWRRRLPSACPDPRRAPAGAGGAGRRPTDRLDARDGLGARVRAQLRRTRSRGAARSARSDDQRRCDLAVGEAVADVAEHLELTPREAELAQPPFGASFLASARTDAGRARAGSVRSRSPKLAASSARSIGRLR